jgi:hypothetical protein
MSGKVPIRVPTGSPVNAFLSRPAAPAPLVEPAADLPEPAPPTPPRAPARVAVPEPQPVPPPVAAVSPRVEATPTGVEQNQEPVVRFQFFLPVRLARLVDAERDRRKASGFRGRGKSDYTAIFRDLVDKHLR